MYLRELRHSLIKLDGIGKKSADAFASLGVHCVADLLLFQPRDYQDRRCASRLVDLTGGSWGYVQVEVLAHDYFAFGDKQTLKIMVGDGSAVAALPCFGRNFLKERLVVGEKFHLYANFSYRYGELQAGTFEFAALDNPAPLFGCLLPVYSGNAALSQALIRKTVNQAVVNYGQYVEDELAKTIIIDRGLLRKGEAIRQLHQPKDFDSLNKALYTLKFEELFYLQLPAARRSQQRDGQQKRQSIDAYRSELTDRLLQRLPFSLTEDQQNVLQIIKNDIAAAKPMARLLQGDVGCGKTIVAFFAALFAIENNRQVALMAPTELLARQHADKAAELLEPLGISVAFLVGSIGTVARDNLLAALQQGKINLLVGTHAMFTDDVIYPSLGLVIIDEQHRFGVLQRAAIRDKGDDPDLLLMTATPIPRTLTMTLFGDMDVCSIRQMPAGRQSVKTHLCAQKNIQKVYDWLNKELSRGRQVYFVYPLISKSEKSRLRDAESMYKQLQENVFPDYRLAILHSRVGEEAKRLIMKQFYRRQLDILVATTVVEVGVDVANATCMVVEHAERFGLSALHQLRGRVGRGNRQSYAFLVYSDEISDDGKKRLKALKNSGDGFEIAEHDLQLRGPGHLAGSRQSGFNALNFADLRNDMTIVNESRQSLSALIAGDPGLLLPNNRPIREVLQRCPPFDSQQPSV